MHEHTAISGSILPVTGFLRPRGAGDVKQFAPFF